MRNKSFDLLPFRAEGIIEELRHRRQWVMWRLEERGGNPTKVPYTPRSDRRASSTDLMAWGTFEEALTSADRYDGIGFVFSSADPYVGVDLDGCIDPKTDNIDPWATRIIEELDSYTERSPSGTGIHIIAKGEIPANGKRGPLEMYSAKQFFTMTGHHLPGRTTIRDRKDALGKLHAELLSHPEENGKANVSSPSPALPIDDDQVIELCRRARNSDKFGRLFDQGDTSEYGGDDSRADQALIGMLAFYTEKFLPIQWERFEIDLQDAYKIRRVFRKLAKKRGSGSLRRLTVFIRHENVLRLLKFLGYRLE